jgi:hypothetical protein
MKLTRRQEEFIENLIDLGRELDGPIHYSLLAERLGVSPFTAYDMLCLLEEKGVVTSEYRLAEGKSGPGRAERLFLPADSLADRRERFASKMALASIDEAELNQFVLDKLRQGDFPNRELAEGVLARIPPEGPEEIRYCVEVMTVVAIRLRERIGQHVLFTYLPQILSADNPNPQANLTLLGGLAFGLLVQQEATDQEWSQMLLEHAQHYQNLVIQMAPEECASLAEALISVFAPLMESVELEAA